MRRLGVWILGWALVGACGDDDASPTDGGANDGAAICVTDEDCDDGVFCNGDELCLPRNPAADARGCLVEDGPPCPADRCVESEARCQADCTNPDADGDGDRSIACGGGDCDDFDRSRSSLLSEICDPGNVDEDCDETTFGDRDDDSDDFVDARCCNGDNCGDDCDDADPSVHPTATEACNGIDDDCNGEIDEGVLIRYFEDADGDGFGSDAEDAAFLDACRPRSGYSERRGDCDETRASVNPAAYDRCDPENVDDDCNGTPNDPVGGCSCTNGTPRTCPLPGVCGAGTQTCTGGTWPTECTIVATDEVCGNGLDEDCDGTADDGCVCDEDRRFCGTDEGVCMRGIQICTSDGAWTACMDAVEPTPETCNDLDDDCDGRVDEGVRFVCFEDTDRDGYSVPAAASMVVCATSCPVGTTARDPSDATMRDCDPSDPDTHPNAPGRGFPRASGGYDYDCNGVTSVVSTPVVCEAAGPRLGCTTSDAGLRSVSGCGAYADFVACATMDSGSGGLFCEEILICAASRRDCGDDNRVKCR
ncbi:MAG: MopE-related protein [Polyangiales bacterium]